MRLRTLGLGLVAVAGLVGASWLVAAEPAKAKEAMKAKAPMSKEMMEGAMMKASAVGQSHAQLKPLAGHWKQEVKWWADPAAPPMVSQGTSETTLIMGGRYLREEAKGEMMNNPFEGLGITGYDNQKKKYVSSWIDNMGTGIMLSEGTCDSSGKVFTFIGSYIDPVTGKNETARMVTRVVDDNKHTFEMHAKSPDGKEFKMMEITYTRM